MNAKHNWLIDNVAIWVELNTLAFALWAAVSIAVLELAAKLLSHTPALQWRAVTRRNCFSPLNLQRRPNQWPKEVNMKPIVRQKKNASMQFALCLLLFCAVASRLFAGDGQLSVGQPTRNGSVDVWVQFPGVFPYGSTASGALDVHVTGITTHDTAQSKAQKIADKINHDFNTNVATPQQTAGGGWQVNLNYNKNGTNIAGVARVALNGDKTGEGASLAFMDLPQPGWSYTAFMGFDTGLSGLDANGGPSTFTASFGYVGLTDSATLSYGQLANQTIDGLVTKLYSELQSGLPTYLQSDLQLNLSNEQITFSFPNGQIGYFGGTSSTDTLVETNGGLGATAPEPSSLFLLGSGVLGLTGFLRKLLLLRT